MGGKLLIRPLNVPTDAEKAALAGVGGTPSGSNKYVTDADERLDLFHGVEVSGTLSFDNSTHVVTLGAGENTYWYQGTPFTTADAVTCDLDSFVTLTANTLYFVYFEDATGTLKAGTQAWDLLTKVPVCTVYWNGTAGAVVNERHTHTRDLRWHTWAHATVGSRISASDFAMTAPSVGSPSTVDFAGGTLYDEDLVSTKGQQTNCRIWYQTGASTYTWVDSNSIYPTNVRFVDSANAYALTDVPINEYINMWVYAAPDIDRGIYAFVETKATSGYTTVASARAANPPSLSAAGVSPELKLLYRIILRGNETFSEFTDYRSSASLPAGGTTAPTAAAVTFTPSGDLAATSVQTALEELDTEKAATSHTHTATDRLVCVIDGGGSAITTGVKARVVAPFSGTVTAWALLADQSGSIVIDVWKDTYANYPPTDADAMPGAGKEPTITAATKGEDTDLADWSSTTITAGDILLFNVDSCSTITWATLMLKVTRTI